MGRIEPGQHRILDMASGQCHPRLGLSFVICDMEKYCLPAQLPQGLSAPSLIHPSATAARDL